MLKVSVPATSANLGPGFDAVGIALELYNHFYFCAEKQGKPPAGSSYLPSYSLVQRAVNLVAREAGMPSPTWQVAIEANIPRSRGLGSSASLTVAGLIAANHYLQAGITQEELINLASKIEGHPDNAAPALLGGLVISISTAVGVKYVQTKPGKPLQAVVAVPEFELPTAQARSVLPRQVSHSDAVKNTGRTALFVSSMILGNYENLGLAMEDLLHQPYRLTLVPGLKEVMAAAVSAGALGSCLSGAGPSILAFVNERAREVQEAMVQTWQEKGIKAAAYLLDIAGTGATIQVASNE